MGNYKKPHLESIQDSPEVKAFIYQVISDFAPFVTPETIVAVVAKDPLKAGEELLADFAELSKKETQSLHRISITLKEGDSKIEAEAVDRDIFIAISLAKNKLFHHLSTVQNDVVTQQERIAEINQALQSTLLH